MINNHYLNKVIQCHIDSGDPETFIVGRICWVSDTWFIVQEVSICGEWDGISLYPQSDLVKIVDNSKYLCNLMYVLEKRGEHPMPIPQVKDFPLQALLQYARDNNNMCSFEQNKSGYNIIGSVSAFDDHYVQIDQYTEDGEPDGSTLILQSSISRIHIGTHFLRYLEILLNS